MEIMINHGAFISGSFIIQCILDENWSDVHKDTDIDIYVPLNEVKEHVFADGTIVYFNKLEDYLYDEMGYDNQLVLPCKRYTRYKNDKELPTMNNIRTYSRFGNNIQIISLNTDNSYDYNHFVDLFDFDICKNIYYPNKKLYVSCIDNIMNRQAHFDVTWNLRLSIKRYYKYTKYGFNIKKDVIPWNELNDGTVHFYARNIYDLPSHIKNKLNIKIARNIKLHREECIQEECFLYFIDPTIKHQHYFDYDIHKYIMIN